MFDKACEATGVFNCVVTVQSCKISLYLSTFMSVFKETNAVSQFSAAVIYRIGISTC